MNPITRHELVTNEQQQLGVLPYQDPRTGRLPPRSIWVFPHIYMQQHAGCISMRGVKQPLQVHFYDNGWHELQSVRLMPNEMYTVPINTAHVIEATLDIGEHEPLL